MDHFGIGAAIRAAVEMYKRASRQTGRSTSLFESVKDGDRIVFATNMEATYAEQRLAEMGKHNVKLLVLPTRYAYRLREQPTSQGLTYFDHNWVEEFYTDAVENAEREIDMLQQQTSGYGEAHRETKRRAVELSRWRI